MRGILRSGRPCSAQRTLAANRIAADHAEHSMYCAINVEGVKCELDALRRGFEKTAKADLKHHETGSLLFTRTPSGYYLKDRESFEDPVKL